MASEIYEDREMDIQASLITASRAYYVKGTSDPFEAAADSDLPSPGDPLPHWPTVTAKRANTTFWSYDQAKVRIHYNNRSLSEEEEGHEHGDTRLRWSWSTIRVQTNVAPGGTYIIPDGWSGDPSALTEATDPDGNQRKDVGSDSGGVSTEMAVPTLHFSLWTEDEPEESDVTAFYNKVNSTEYRGYEAWRFWCRGADVEEMTTGTADSDAIFQLSFELALLDAPGGWQEIWQELEWKENDVDGQKRKKKIPVDPRYLSKVKEEADFNEIETSFI